MHMTSLPSNFCWTKYGVESGESIREILARKEHERLSSGGMFLWGIGNSVRPAIRELILREVRPRVVFSPMRCKAKAIDTTPGVVLNWTSAIDLNGNSWEIPETLSVVSRGSSEAGRRKTSHYALVCRSDRPLTEACAGEVVYEHLLNLLSMSRLGHSQVTAVVSRRLDSAGIGPETTYPVGLVADLVFPYFVKLQDPEVFNGIRRSKSRTIQHHGLQASLYG